MSSVAESSIKGRMIPWFKLITKFKIAETFVIYLPSSAAAVHMQKAPRSRTERRTNCCGSSKTASSRIESRELQSKWAWSDSRDTRTWAWGGEYPLSSSHSSHNFSVISCCRQRMLLPSRAPSLWWLCPWQTKEVVAFLIMRFDGTFKWIRFVPIYTILLNKI